MELQLHESGYRTKKIYRNYGAIKHNTAKRLLSESYGTPTYYQFLREENLSGLEDDDQLAGKFGSWLKKTAGKVGKFAVKAQQALSPIIGVLPGGGLVNAAFDVVSQVKQAGQPAQVEPVVTAMPTATPALPTAAIMPTPSQAMVMPPPSQAMVMPPPSQTMIMPPPPQLTPDYSVAPQYSPAIYSAPGAAPGLFGLDTKSLLLYGLGGLLAYKLLTKK